MSWNQAEFDQAVGAGLPGAGVDVGVEDEVLPGNVVFVTETVRLPGRAFTVAPRARADKNEKIFILQVLCNRWTQQLSRDSGGERGVLHCGNDLLL